MPRISSITAVDIALAKSLPPKIIVTATGTVPTSGWTKPELSQWFYIRAPDDGIQDFDFVAQAPTGPALERISPIEGVTMLEADPSNYWGSGKPLKGVRIHSQTNSVQELLSPKANFALSDGRPVPWPWSAADQLNIQNTQLVGRLLRVYKTGDNLQLDYNYNRFNIELSPETGLIVRTWFG